MEAASIEGKEFARQRLEALVDDGASEPVGIHLHALIRKDLIRPVGASEDTFRFRHQLIRDGAYERMPGSCAPICTSASRTSWTRAPRPCRSPMSCSATTSSAPSCSRRELGEAEAATAEVAARASSSLRAAGRRAMARDDPASVRLLERALALVPENDRAPVLVELANALDEVGDLEGCAATGTAALELACANGPTGGPRRAPASWSCA